VRKFDPDCLIGADSNFAFLQFWPGEILTFAQEIHSMQGFFGKPLELTIKI